MKRGYLFRLGSVGLKMWGDNSDSGPSRCHRTPAARRFPCKQSPVSSIRANKKLSEVGVRAVICGCQKEQEGDAAICGKRSTLQLDKRRSYNFLFFQTTQLESGSVLL